MPQDLPVEPLVTTSLASKRVGVSRGLLARYKDEGLITPTWTTPDGQVRWHVSDLVRQLGLTAVTEHE